MSEIKKVVLAYSGGLDTSIIIPWLKENYNDPEIIAVSGDVGQGAELDGLEEKAIKTGASKLYVEDLTDQMVDEVIIPSMMMGAKYEDYLLGTAFASPSGWWRSPSRRAPTPSATAAPERVTIRSASNWPSSALPPK